MNTISHIFRQLWVVSVLLLSALSCHGQILNLDLSIVPASLPAAQRASLQAKREDIRQREAAFEKEYSAAAAKYAHVIIGTPEEAGARRVMAELQKKADALRDAADEFNLEVEAAVKALPPKPPETKAAPSEAEHAQAQIDALMKQKKFIETQRAILKNIEKGQQQLVTENVTASLDLINDTQSQLISMVGGIISMSGAPENVSRAAGLTLHPLQAYYLERGRQDATDERRKREKAMDEIGELKNFVATLPGVLSGPESGAVKSATDATLKIYKIIDRHQTPEVGATSLRADLELVSGALIDVTKAVNPVLGGALKSTNSSIYVAGGAWALRAMDRNRAELERALKQNATALSYYDNRMNGLEKDLVFWQDRLNQMKAKK